jgi:hypothetical protein
MYIRISMPYQNVNSIVGLNNSIPISTYLKLRDLKIGTLSLRRIYNLLLTFLFCLSIAYHNIIIRVTSINKEDYIM